MTFGSDKYCAKNLFRMRDCQNYEILSVCDRKLGLSYEEREERETVRTLFCGNNSNA